MYMRLNIVSLFFIVASFISATLAWFAYSGISNVATEVGVKAWYIQLDGDIESNRLVVSSPYIYPGMETITEKVNIKNLGDSDAQVKYSILSARILDDPDDNYVVGEGENTSEYVEDILSHDYPFHININLSRGHISSGGGESVFEVSISWPLDSGTDSFDSLWGTKAYQFQINEEAKQAQDNNYEIRLPIQIVISLTAEQYLEEDGSSDPRFNLGDTILFDISTNSRCSKLSETCITTYVMDVDNKLGVKTDINNEICETDNGNELCEEKVMLLPDPKNVYASGTYNNYSTLLATVTSGWAANTRPLLIDDIMKIISTDIIDSVLVRNNMSDSIIGKLRNHNRISTELAKVTADNVNGYYQFKNDKFSNLSSTNCYWINTEYNANKGFAVKKIDENVSKVYGEDKTETCKVIPVIMVSKSNL